MMTDSATGSLNSVVFWDSKTFLRRKSAQPFPKSSQLASLSWSSSNPKLAVVPQWGDRIAICDFHDDIMTWSFLLHKEGGVFTCGTLMHNSRYLASGCGNSTVLIWDLKNKSIIKTFQGHSSPVSSIARSSNDHLVVSGSQNGTILMHTVSNSAAQKMVNLTKDTPLKRVVSRLSFSYMEKSHLGSVCDNGAVCLWSTESQRMLAQLTPSHTSPATDICFSPSNKMLMVSVGLDSTIKCYDIQTRKTVTEITSPAPLSSVALLKDGTTLVGGGADGKLYIYELRLVKSPRDIIDAHQSPVTCIAQQHMKSSSRRASSRGSVSSAFRSKGTPPSPNKTTSVLVSSPEKPSTTDEPGVTSSSTVVAPTALSSTAAAHLDSRPRREEETPLIGRAGHIQPVAPPPETVTPFVTTQHQGVVAGGGVKGGKKVELLSGLNVQTPLGVALKHQSKPDEGLPFAMATPANPQGHTSSIFSPIDVQLVTPVHKVTAAIAPTVRSTPLDSAHSVTPLGSSVQPGSVTQSQFASGGIFSPLDSGHHGQTSFTHPSSVATPGGVVGSSQGKLDTSLNLSAMGPPSSMTSAGVTMSRFSGPSPSVVEGLASQPTPTHPLEYRNVMGMKQGSKDLKEVDRGSTEPFSAAQPPQQSVSDTLLPPSSHLPPTDLPKEETSSSSSTSLPISLPPKHEIVPDTQPASSHVRPTPQLESSAASGLPSAPGIEMKFMENMIKDSQEELWYSVHKDIRALSVDIFRQFFAMQQQSAAQFAALNEKVERLSEENKRLQEMVYQYMPKH